MPMSLDLWTGCSDMPQKFHVPPDECPFKTAQRKHDAALELARRGYGPNAIAKLLDAKLSDVLRWLYD